MVKLDLKDLKILAELDRDARQPVSAIAKKVRLNKNTVNYKINRLVDEGIIQNYYTVIDNSRLGYFSFRVYLKFFNTSSKNEVEIINWLIKKQNIGVVARMESVYDLVFFVWVKNAPQFDKLWVEFKERFREYFWREKVDIFYKVHHFQRNYLTDKNDNKINIVGGGSLEKYDSLDLEILNLLAKDARAPIIDISEKLEIPPRTAAFRIKNLEKKGIIQGYRVNFNLKMLGYEAYKLNIVLNSFQNPEEFLEYFKDEKNIIYLDHTLSNLDLEVDVEVKDRGHLLEIIGKIKSKFKVREIEILAITKYHKIELIPMDMEN